MQKHNEKVEKARTEAQKRANKTGLAHYVTMTYDCKFQVRKGVAPASNPTWHYGTFQPQPTEVQG